MSSCLATEKIVFFLVKTLQDIRTGWHKEDHKHKQEFGLELCFPFCQSEYPFDYLIVSALASASLWLEEEGGVGGSREVEKEEGGSRGKEGFGTST